MITEDVLALFEAITPFIDKIDLNVKKLKKQCEEKEKLIIEQMELIQEANRDLLIAINKLNI